jgi:FkbM family methyltransferase
MNKLIDFCLDTENPEKNYRLAQWYEEQGHTGPAHTYYLRAAERSEDKNFSYMSLLRSAICCKKQQTREVTEKSLIDSALVLLPERPEAYYLLCLFYEKKQDWQNCYLYASLGLSCYKNELEDIDIPEYKGKYLLIYQKAISSWWWGKGKETRELFDILTNEYWELMNDDYKKLINNNLVNILKQPEIKNDKKFTYPKDFDWADLTEEDIFTIDREIVHENVYRFWNDVKEGDTVLDIGASVGAYTISILDQKPKKVYCVEPSENLLKTLIKNCSEKLFNSSNTEIKYINNGIVENYDDSINVFGNDKSFIPITFKELIENYSINFINYMKVDCEGGEYSIFNDDNIDFILNNVAFISMEIHLKGDGFREKFKNFRNKYLSKFEDYKVVSCTRQNINWGESIDITNMIFDDNFIDEYNCEFMIYIDNKKSNLNKKFYQTSKEIINDETWEKYKLVPKEMNTSTPTSKFSFLNNNKNTAWIVDNFYDNPDEIRKFALEQEFGDESVITGFVGRRTFNQFLFPGLKEAFESIMGKKITKWEEHGMNGRFQICWSGERLVYHCDSQKWGGMLYLSPNAPYQCGTTLYADKKNRARTYYDSGWDDYWANTPGDCHLDGTPFEPVDVLGNVYNRLVIFDASCIHSASEYFGTNKENARLWQMFFFDTES